MYLILVDGILETRALGEDVFENVDDVINNLSTDEKQSILDQNSVTYESKVELDKALKDYLSSIDNVSYKYDGHDCTIENNLNFKL